MIRITADIDKTPLKVVKTRTKALMIYLYKYHKIIFNDFQVKRSSGKKGYHIILWCNNRLTKKKIIFLRYLFGDDVKRIQIDLKRRRSRQFLFKSKKYIKNH